MPLRLLGLVPDLESINEIGGSALAAYAQNGVGVTVAAASSADSGNLVARARLLGIQALVLLDYRPAERDSPGLTDLLADLLRAIKPHVVLLARDPAILSAGTHAFEAARRHPGQPGQPGKLPAKLYTCVEAGSPEMSTEIRFERAPWAASASFRRISPSPWVTGIVERDLFAGLGPDRPESIGWFDERRAS